MTVGSRDLAHTCAEVSSLLIVLFLLLLVATTQYQPSEGQRRSICRSGLFPFLVRLRLMPIQPVTYSAGLKVDTTVPLNLTSVYHVLKWHRSYSKIECSTRVSHHLETGERAISQSASGPLIWSMGESSHNCVQNIGTIFAVTFSPPKDVENSRPDS